MRIRMIITALMLLLSATLSAQSHQPSDIIHQPSDRLSAQSHQPSDRMAAYREAIGLDMTVPDFSTKKIDAKVMGPRLAGILEYLLENYKQGTYERLIALMLGEQYEALQDTYFYINKMKFVSAAKKGNELTILMKVWPDKNTRDVKQADLIVHFIDGVSESQSANELFSYMSRYVQAHEKLNQ